MDDGVSQGFLTRFPVHRIKCHLTYACTIGSPTKSEEKTLKLVKLFNIVRAPITTCSQSPSTGLISRSDFIGLNMRNKWKCFWRPQIGLDTNLHKSPNFIPQTCLVICFPSQEKIRDGSTGRGAGSSSKTQPLEVTVWPWERIQCISDKGWVHLLLQVGWWILIMTTWLPVKWNTR